MPYFPLRYWTKVEASAVQGRLRAAFERWGLPDAMRFDNGKPWGNPQVRVPTSLALWLVGLGVRVVFGRPRVSTDNAVVERAHGVLNAWVEPQRCTNVHQLQAQLSTFVALQRERYPACQGQSRLQAFPALRQKRRPYHEALEVSLWHLRPVLDYLAHFRFARKVEKNGRITLLTHEYSIGAAFRAQSVTARLNPANCEWLIFDRHNTLLKTFPATQLCYETIANMQLTHQHFKAKRRVAPQRV